MRILFLIAIQSLLLTSCFPPGSQESGGSPVITFLPFILIFILFYFLILRPQRKQRGERENLLSGLKRGDRIITSGGIYGRIINIDDDLVTLEIAKGINIQVSKPSISGKVNTEKVDSKPKGGKE